MSRFSKNTEYLLRKSGWFYGRRSKIDYKHKLLELGWKPNVHAINFLNEFGGIELKVPQVVVSWKFHWFWGYSTRLLGHLYENCNPEIDRIDDYETRRSILGDFCLIGCSQSAIGEYFISSNGVLYGSDVNVEQSGGPIYKYGNNIDDAIECFCLARRKEVVATVPRKECSPQCPEGRHK